MLNLLKVLTLLPRHKELAVLQEYCEFNVYAEPNICVYFLQQCAALNVSMRYFCDEMFGPMYEDFVMQPTAQ